MATTVKLYTGDDLAAMPGDEPWERWEGALRTVPGAGGEASEIACDHWLPSSWPLCDPGGSGVVTTTDGTYYLARHPDTIIVPDVGFVRWEHLPDRTRPNGYIPSRRIWRSRSSRRQTRPAMSTTKMALYRRVGVPLVWWIYPERRAVIVFARASRRRRCARATRATAGRSSPGSGLLVAEIFAEA